MKFEKSCGAVVFTRREEEILYVIIRATNGDYGFPKGHMERGEPEQVTALREIREEVGVDAAIVGDFRMADSYPLPNKPGVVKQVVYFLAEYSGQELRPQPEEVSAVYLMPFEKARKALSFAETKRILTEANRFLNQ